MITKLVLEMDARFGKYSKCNICYNGHDPFNKWKRCTDGQYVCSCWDWWTVPDDDLATGKGCEAGAAGPRSHHLLREDPHALSPGPRRPPLAPPALPEAWVFPRGNVRVRVGGGFGLNSQPGICLVGGGGSGRVPSEEPCGWRWVLLSCP